MAVARQLTATQPTGGRQFDAALADLGIRMGVLM